MAAGKLCVATVVLLSLHASQCYILLTANLDDVHALAKQIAASPVAKQLNQIIRRASSVFNQQFQSKGGQQKPQLRSDPSLDEPQMDAGDNSRGGDKSRGGGKAHGGDKARGGGNTRGGGNARGGGGGSDGSDVEVWKPDPKDEVKQNSRISESEISELSSEHEDSKVNRIERRHQVGPDLVELGKNASFYLTSIKKIFENV